MCSLTEAFQTFVDPVPRNDNLLGEFAEEPPSNQNNYESLEKRKKKKRRAPMPPSEQVIEPDRPAHRSLPSPELLVLGNKESTSQSNMLNALDVDEHFPHPSIDSGNKNPYMLEPEWATVFNDSPAPSWIKDRMARKEAEAPLIPSPWMDGGSTLWTRVPEDQTMQANIEKVEKKADDSLDVLQRKFDSMFKKLEDLESSRSESQHLEIILVVLGGFFIILLLDMLIKQGNYAMNIIGTVGNVVGGATVGGATIGSGINTMGGGFRMFTF